MAWISLNNLTRFYTKLKEKFYLKTEIDTKISELNNKIRINYLRPTQQTATVNGVTLTDNGDGTYTLNGTCTEYWYIILNRITLPKGKYKAVDCVFEANGTWYLNTFELNESATGNVLYVVNKGSVENNLVIKPMITDDLSATYDDFVSYDDSLVTGINSGLKMDLLWTNASPKSTFGGQTINLDLSQYKQIKIVFKLATDVNNIECSNFFNLSNNYILTPMYQSYGSSSGSFVAFREIAYIKASGINIGNGKKATAFTSYSDDDSLIIPYQIYGVK